jgi:hypothetical protein
MHKPQDRNRIGLAQDTQKQRLLDLLRERGSQGVKVYEIMAPRPEGLGIAQYNARILELRRNGYRIINKEPGHFVLAQEGETYEPQYTFEPRQRKSIYRTGDSLQREQLGFTI